MRLARRTTLLVALSLLGSAATACAECAWVLWYRVTEYRDGEATEAPFDAGEAHPTLAACQGVLQERLTEWALVEATNPDHSPPTMRRLGFLVIALSALSGCAGGGPIYWTRTGSGFDQFQVDHQACLPTFSKDGYRNCMKSRGWVREHTSSGLPDERHFRGP